MHFVWARRALNAPCRRVSARAVEPLVAVLSPTAFEQLWKDLTYELGQIYSEVRPHQNRDGL